jgi:hypothetical protein
MLLADAGMAAHVSVDGERATAEHGVAKLEFRSEGEHVV